LIIRMPLLNEAQIITIEARFVNRRVHQMEIRHQAITLWRFLAVC
jgi:hypothetical protein